MIVHFCKCIQSAYNTTITSNKYLKSLFILQLVIYTCTHTYKVIIDEYFTERWRAC